MIVSRQSVASLVHQLTEFFATLVHTHVKADVTDLETISVAAAPGHIPKVDPDNSKLSKDWIPYVTAGPSSGEQIVATSSEGGLIDLGLLPEIPDSQFRDSAGLSVVGRSANSTGDVADITAGTDGHVLRRSGTTLAFGQVATAGLANDSVANATLRNSAALSVIGNAASGSGDPADIAASAADQVLRVNGPGDALAFGTLATGGIAASAVTNAKLADMAQSTVKGRAAAAGTGAPTDLSGSQVKAIIGSIDTADIANDAVTNVKLANMANGTIKGRTTSGTGDPEDLTTLPTAAMPALTGDVTNSAGALATTIANDAVTNAKAANMADSTIKGRASGAGTGDPTDLTAAQVQAILGTRSLRNLLVNGGLGFAQRQAPGTLTTYSNTTGRTYAADYWCITNENASAQFQRVDTSVTTVAGITARYYGVLKKITSTGKILFSQVMEAEDVMPYRGRTVNFQMNALNGVGSHTLRMVLLQLNSSGAADTIPATFVSAFGAASTDPTWGTNLAAITPSTANANCSISGAGLTCTLSGSATVFGGTFVVPSNCLNLVAVIFTDDRPVANDTFFVTEVGLYEGTEQRAWLPANVQEEFARCQRRCWKTFNRDTAPATNAGQNTGEQRFIMHTAGASTNKTPTIVFPVPMRAAPTVTTYNPQATNAQVRNQNTGADCSATATANVQERGMFLTCTGDAGSAVGNTLGVHLLCEDNL
jgi:hypothetical protein